jgi:CRP-like cAMP-binding protein
LRAYYLTEQGIIKTRLIATQGMVASSLGSFISRQPSFELLDVLEDSAILIINRVDFFQLLDDFPEWRQFYTTLLESAYLFQNKKIEQLVTLSALERYQLLLKDRPDLVNRVSNKVLASYLDITQETLSRLKSK